MGRRGSAVVRGGITVPVVGRSGRPQLTERQRTRFLQAEMAGKEREVKSRTTGYKRSERPTARRTPRQTMHDIAAAAAATAATAAVTALPSRSRKGLAATRSTPGPGSG